jgi:hypothetical protein
LNGVVFDKLLLKIILIKATYLLFMAHPLSTLGIIHTVISILALIAAFICLFRQGIIDPASRGGKAYIWLTVITCLTGFPIMSTGQLGPAHFLTVLVLILLPLGVFAKRLALLGVRADYFQVIVMSFTLFLSFVPAINETFKRIPIGHPLATGPDDPIIKQWVAVLLLLFITGTTYQLIRLRKRKRKLLTVSPGL